MGLAAAIGPLVGGELTERFGWRAVFAANLPVIGVSFLLVLMSRGVYSKARPAADRPSFDWPGSALLACGLTLTIVALRMSGGAAWGLGGSGAALLVAFAFWERRASSPLIDFSLLKRGAFFGGGSIIALQNMAMYPLLFQLPVFFDRVRNLGARTMGQALLALTLAIPGGRAAGGKIRRAGAGARRLAARPGGLVVVCGFLVRARAARRHARHGADRCGHRHDIAYCASCVDEHGGTRSIWHGRRHAFDDAIHRRRGGHYGARRPAARSGQPRVPSTSVVRLSRRAGHRRGVVTAAAARPAQEDGGKPNRRINCRPRRRVPTAIASSARHSSPHVESEEQAHTYPRLRYFTCGVRRWTRTRIPPDFRWAHGEIHGDVQAAWSARSRRCGTTSRTASRTGRTFSLTPCFCLEPASGRLRKGETELAALAPISELAYVG